MPIPSSFCHVLKEDPELADAIPPARLAALDCGFEQRLTQYPELALVAARRPTVTTALSDLTKRSLVRTDGETWVLPGEAPSDLIAFAHAADDPAGPDLN